MRHPYWEIRGLGVEMIALVNDTPETNHELRERLDLPFSLLSDPDAEIARKFQVFHDDEPKGRNIARVSLFLVDGAGGDGHVLWEHVSPTHHHRVPPSMLLEVIQTALGRKKKIVSVFVPDGPSSVDQDPGRRILASEITMGAQTEIHRLTGEGWTLQATVPETGTHGASGNRWVFTKT